MRRKSFFMNQSNLSNLSGIAGGGGAHQENDFENNNINNLSYGNNFLHYQFPYY
jgi:hypothetical protein